MLIYHHGLAIFVFYNNYCARWFGSMEVKILVSAQEKKEKENKFQVSGQAEVLVTSIYLQSNARRNPYSFW